MEELSQVEGVLQPDIRIEDRVSQHYDTLSAKLRAAADYVVANQLDVATRSLRNVSATSGLAPATFSRLARALEFDTFEALRETCRGALWDRGASFADRAARLTGSPAAEGSILERHSSACARNISDMSDAQHNARLAATVDVLAQAGQVLLFGTFSSTGIVEYMAYLAQYCRPNWSLAGRMGTSLGQAVTDLGAGDVLLIVTKTPYARRAVAAADLARENGAKVVVITDSHTCPALKFAAFSFIVPSDSPQFFSSYAATIALIETMIAMLVAQDPDRASARIREVELQNQRLGEFWADHHNDK